MPIKYRLPADFRQKIPGTLTLEKMRSLSRMQINTVCREAKCPNFAECLSENRLTFLILGNTCTRRCGFCSVTKAQNRSSLLLDPDEPKRIAELAQKMKLKYVVITSVTRDDLKDGGAAQFAKTIQAIRSIGVDIKIEALIPDFSGKTENLETVINACPDVLAHNLETVKRLYEELRPGASYDLSLGILKRIKEINSRLITKSSLILGLGETKEELIQSMRDLRKCGCDILTLGQYLAPSEKHYPVKEFIARERLNQYRDIGMNFGFRAVLAGPRVRSSYQAEKIYSEVTYA